MNNRCQRCQFLERDRLNSKFKVIEIKLVQSELVSINIHNYAFALFYAILSNYLHLWIV